MRSTRCWKIGVDNFLSRGNLQGGFNWYLSNHRARIAIMQGKAPPVTPITVATRVAWGAEDTVIKAEWGDRLGEYFTDLEFEPMHGLGHFPAYGGPGSGSDGDREVFCVSFDSAVCGLKRL